MVGTKAVLAWPASAARSWAMLWTICMLWGVGLQ